MTEQPRLTDAALAAIEAAGQPKSDNSEHDLSRLPSQVRERLSAASLPDLIGTIEKSGFEDEGGPLTNRIEWLELKARIEALGRLMPHSP